MSTDYSNLKSQYPPVISADQFRQICHISKRKAKWLLENNIVPCEDSGKKTRRFSIRIEAAISYLTNREDAPTLVATPPGAFSSGYQHPGVVPRRSPIPPQIFEQYLLKRWRDAPDALTIPQAEKLTGYAAPTLGEWIKQEKLQAVWYYNHYQIPKVSLIACLMKLESESRHYYSPQHLEMTRDINVTRFSDIYSFDFTHFSETFLSSSHTAMNAVWLLLLKLFLFCKINAKSEYEIDF